MQGLKFMVVLGFIFTMISSFLKPYLHMNQQGELRVDQEGLAEKFNALDPYTPSVGLAFGILAFSSTLS